MIVAGGKKKQKQRQGRDRRRGYDQGRGRGGRVRGSGEDWGGKGKTDGELSSERGEGRIGGGFTVKTEWVS